MKIRLAAYLQPDSIVDGEGIRTVIWTQGCPHHCFGCQNPETHDFNGGAEVDVEEVKSIIDGLKGQDGITFSGGDPMAQPGPCAEIAKYARTKGYNIWCYTGYDFEKDVLGTMVPKFEITKDFLKKIDVVVDGQFEEEKKLVDLKFRGSYNQRKIDVQKTLEQKSLVTMKFGDEERFGGVA